MTDDIDIREINLPLLRRAIDHIETNPATFNYDTWWATYDPYDVDVVSEELDRPIRCGTVGCLAGWIVELGTIKGAHVKTSHRNRAMELLGVDGWVANALFAPDEDVNRDPVHLLRRHVENVLDMEPGTL